MGCLVQLPKSEIASKDHTLTLFGAKIIYRWRLILLVNEGNSWEKYTKNYCIDIVAGSCWQILSGADMHMYSCEVYFLGLMVSI